MTSQKATAASTPEIPTLPLLGIFDIDKAHCDVVLTEDRLSWTLIQPSGKDVKHGTHQQSLNLKDVFAVRIKRLQKDKQSRGYAQGVTLFTRKPKRGSCLLRQSNVTLCATNEECCQRWMKAITHIISGYKERPKQLRIFVDTGCENGNAMHVFYKKVQPLLQLAKVGFDVVESAQPGHARQVVQVMKYGGLDGIVCVGDDKIVTEVSNGLLVRAQSDARLQIKPDQDKLAKCCVPLGIIPLGPFNLVAHSSQGASDPVTSTLHIIYGNIQAIDVCTFFQNGHFLRFGFSAMYGFGGDCLRRAEKKKKLLGKRRAEYAVARSIMKLRPYECELSFLPCSDVDGCIQDRTPCQAGCPRCQADWCLVSSPSVCPNNSKESAFLCNSLQVPRISIGAESSVDNSSVSSFSSSEGIRRKPLARRPSGQSSESSKCSEIPRPPSRNSWVEGMDDLESNTIVAEEQGAGHAGIASHCQTMQQRIQGIAVLPDGISDTEGASDWRTIKGTFFSVSVMTLPNLCSLCPEGMSPLTHLADGSADLILAKTTTKSDFVQHLRRYGSDRDQFDLPFMCVRRIKAVRISPKGTTQTGCDNSLLIQQSTADLVGSETSQDTDGMGSPRSLSVWNVDMELLQSIPLEIRVHKQVLKVFGMGIAYVDKSPATCGCL